MKSLKILIKIISASKKYIIIIIIILRVHLWGVYVSKQHTYVVSTQPSPVCGYPHSDYYQENPYIYYIFFIHINNKYIIYIIF